MAVAEKPIAERAPRSPQAQLAFKSLLGAVYVLFSLGMIFSGLPLLWAEIFPTANEFLSAALLLFVEIGVAVGLLLLGLKLEKHNPPHGLRAGIFAICVAVFLIGWISLGIGSLLAGAELGATAVVISAAIAAGLAFGAFRLFMNPAFMRSLQKLDDQGWFHAIAYKANQGVRVRRGTMLALLTLGICGIITLISHRALGSSRFGSNDWEIVLPFTDSVVNGVDMVRTIPLMFHVHYTVPLVLAVLLIWFSWRVVNWPVFADFLIATEAEMNKVSWTTRRRLVQDTIVVLVAVVLLTLFLFFIDLFWIKVLKSDYIQVLRIDVREEQLKQQEKSPW